MVPKNALYPQDVLDRFWAKVEKKSPTECWEWTAGTSKPYRYGVFHPRKPLTVGAHRFSLELKLGRPIKPGMYACHTCDYPPCVNPNHLYEGTHQDNVNDAVRRDRHKRGERGAEILTDNAVISMREEVAGGMLVSDAAVKYGVSRAMASMVTSGKRWGHIGGPITSGIHESHCVNGHEYTTSNTILRNGGLKKVCRTCNNINQARYRAKRKALSNG